MKTNTLNLWFTRFLALAAVCTLVGCSLFNKVVESISAIEKAQLVDKYEPSEQYYLGRGVSAVILDRYPPIEIKNAQTERQVAYLNDMAGYIERASQSVTRSALRLGDHTERDHDQQQQVYDLALYKGVQVGILDTEDVAAHGTPGGFLWLSYGAIKMCESEDELAAVVAHEMSHIILDHGMANYRIAYKSEVRNSTLSDTWFSGSGAVSNFGRLCVTYAEDAFNGYNPEQEFESDNWGTRALTASGYDPNAMVAVLKRVEAYEKAHDVDPKDYLAHHPPITERIKTVQELIKSEGFKVNPASQKPEAVKARNDRFTAAFK
ncbi:MAG: M48 family metallopeptidase [Planctomycetes bacterium]|nr:M48 family metallopeptidase [Planctomycetota bacterium]